MPVKRRNHGRSRKHCGKKRPVHCMNCGRLTGKDKCVKR
jgi:small subunit ribosomal protein S26e